DFQALIEGRVSGSRWDFGDGAIVSNRPLASHIWQQPGSYDVELRGFNETAPSGVAAKVTVNVLPRPMHYVSLSSPSPVPPYSSWDTAATNVQDAIDVAAVRGALILVSNGIYLTGAQLIHGMSNRVSINKTVTVQSLSGPGSTIIQGQGPQGPAAI